MIDSVNIINDLQYLFFPDCCLGCEKIITKKAYPLCVHCRHQLPLTSYNRLTENHTDRILYGRVRLRHAYSLLWYHRNSLVQRIIHQIKYRHQEAAGAFFGRWIGHQLLEYPELTSVDMVIPVPLHPEKKRKRGYNQTEKMARAMAEVLQAEFRKDILKRTTGKRTQTKVNRINRNFNEDNPFMAEPRVDLRGKHILLTDDVITTGATLEFCAHALASYPDVTLSIATLAITA